MPRIIRILPLLLIPPLVGGCLTTLAISAAAGSGGGGEHLETAKEIATDAADHVANVAGEAAESIRQTMESFGSD